MNAYWNWRATHVDGQFGGEHASWSRVVGEFFPSSPKKVLDLGTGAGGLAFLLADRGHRVVGIDLSKELLGLAQRCSQELGSGPLFELGDAHHPPFPEGSFDIITSRYLLWTLTDPKAAFTNWYRVLRPGGLLIAFDGLWSLLRQKNQQAENERTRALDVAFRDYYGPEEQARLPWFSLESPAEIGDLAREQGFEKVRVRDHEAKAYPLAEPLQEFVLIAERPC